MFRQTALKKGHLKPVKLFLGGLGGSSTPALPNPMFGPPQPNMMQRFMARPSVRMVKGLGKGILGIPQIGGYYAGDKVGQALGIESELARMPFGLTGAYAATKAMPALAALPAATSAAIMAGPAYLTIAGKMERDRIKAMSPAEREAHKRKSMQFGSSYLDDEQFNEQFGNFKPKTPEELNAGIKRPDSRRPGPRRFNTDRLTETGNESEVVKGSVDIDKVVKNNDPNTPVTGAADTVEEKSFKDEVKVAKQEKITNKQANTKVVNSETNKLDKPGKYKAADGTEITSPVIELARKYRKELMAGQKSQAGLVFLSNLASGLLSGTSTSGGLGGALEHARMAKRTGRAFNIANQISEIEGANGFSVQAGGFEYINDSPQALEFEFGPGTNRSMAKITTKQRVPSATVAAKGVKLDTGMISDAGLGSKLRNQLAVNSTQNIDATVAQETVTDVINRRPEELVMQVYDAFMGDSNSFVTLKDTANAKFKSVNEKYNMLEQELASYQNLKKKVAADVKRKMETGEKFDIGLNGEYKSMGDLLFRQSAIIARDMNDGSAKEKAFKMAKSRMMGAIIKEGGNPGYQLGAKSLPVTPQTYLKLFNYAVDMLNIEPDLRKMIAETNVKRKQLSAKVKPRLSQYT